MIELFNQLKFYIIGSNYFFKNMPNYTPHDLDYGTFFDNFENTDLKYFGDKCTTCKTVINGNDYFIWKKDTPENLIREAFTKDPMCSGKYLIPEICESIGFKIDHLKQLESIFKNMDYRHYYEKIIYDAYIENNDFYLTDYQRNLAYNEYLKDRLDIINKGNYSKNYFHWVIYFNRSKKFPFQHNDYGRPTGLLAAFLLSEQEHQFAIDTYYYLKKYYPEVYAYECVNYTPFKKDFIIDSFNLNFEGPIKVVDIDIKNNEDIEYHRDIEYNLKNILINENIHCDMQRSPHGFHLILKENSKEIFNRLNKIFNEKNKDIREELINKKCFKSLPYVDIISNIKTLDGIEIDGIKIETIKNWT